MRIFPEVHVFVVVSVGAIHPVVGKEDTVAGMDDTEAEMEGIVADMATVGGTSRKILFQLVYKTGAGNRLLGGPTIKYTNYSTCHDGCIVLS